MKIFNKVLALVLALFTVLTVLPMSVLANSWVDVDTETTGDATKVTVTLDAKALAELLQREGISPDLLWSLKDGATVDAAALREAFSVQDLFDIIPRDEWLKVFDIEEILNQLGLETLMGYVDTEGLLKEILADGAALEKLEAMLASVEDLDKCFDALTLLQKGYIVSKTNGQTAEDLILSCISDANRVALVNAIKAEPAKLDKLITYLETAINGTGFDLVALKNLLDVDQIIEDEVISVSAVVDTDKVEALIESNKIKVSEIVSTSKVQYLIENEKITVGEIVNSKAVLDLIETDKIDLAKIISYNDVKALITDGTLVADEVVKMDVAATKMQEAFGGARGDELIAKIENLINKDNFKSYLETKDLNALSSYVVTDGEGNIVSMDTAALIKDGKITIEEILDNNDEPCKLVDETALAKVAVEYVNVSEVVDTAAVEAIITVENSSVSVDAVINKEAVKTYVDDPQSGVSLDDIIDKDAVKKIIDDPNRPAVTVDSIIDTVAVQGIVNDPNSGINLDDVIDVDAAKTALLALDNDELMIYVDTAEAFRLLMTVCDVNTMITELIGGYDKAMSYIDIPALIDSIDLVATINNIPSAELSNVIYFDVLISKLSINQILEIVEPQKILNHLEDGAIVDIAKTVMQSVDLKGMATDVAALLADKLLKNVDLVKINGYTVAAERESDELLEIYSEQLVMAIQDLIPELDDFITLENNVIFSTTVELGYTVDGTTQYKNKKIEFEFVLAGNLDAVRNAAAKLKTALNQVVNTDTFEISPEAIVMELTIPTKATVIYTKLLNLDALTPELRETIMAMTTASADGTINLLNEKFTFENVIAILDAIEPSALYERVKAQSLVKTCLDKLGANVSEKDLNEMVQFILEKASDQSIESVCAAIEARTGRNVYAYLQTLSVKADGYVDKAEEISVVNTLLSAVESKFGIDVSDVSVEEILNRGKDVPVIDKVAEVVARKVGKNALDVLNTYSPDELYDKAVNKASEYESQYNKVKNSLISKFYLLPVELQNASFADIYNGNGVFAKSSDFTYNPKAILEKAINRVFSKISVPTVEDAVELLVSRLSGNSITMNVDVSVNVEDIRKIEFVTRDGGKVLLTAFLPIGTDLNVYKNNSPLAGYEFTGWATADGVQLETMPDYDVTVYADLHMNEVTFVDENDKVLGHFMVHDGATLADYAERLAEIEALIDTTKTENPYLYGSNTIGWLMGTEKVDVKTTQITEDTTLKLSLTPAYYLGFADADFAYELTEKDGVYTLTILGELPESFVLNFVRTNNVYSDILTRAIAETNVRLDVAVKNDAQNFTFVAFDNAILALMGTKSNETATDKVSFVYQTTDAAESGFGKLFGNNMTGVATYDFSIVNGDAMISDFEGATIAIQVPFAQKENTKTHVYTIEDGNRVLLDDSVESTDGKYITFYAKHFSEFMVATEYSVTYMFEEAGKQVCEMIVEHYPAGATFKFGFAVPTGYQVVTDGIAYGNETYSYGDTFTMVDANIEMTVTLTGRVYHVYFYVNGILNGGSVENGFEDLTISYTAAQIQEIQNFLTNTYPQGKLPTAIADLAPEGYSKSGVWAGFTTELGVKDLYFFAKWDLKTYTINFVANGVTVSTIEGVTAENYQSKYVVPEVPAVTAKVGTWDTANKSIDETTGVVTITATYVDMTYAIVAGPNVTVSASTATPGTSITVSATDKVGYTTTITVKDANGDDVPLTNGAFTMPASVVYVNVTYAVKTFNYTINGVAGEPKPYGSTVEFFFNVRKGEYLASISNVCTLVSTTVDANGTKTLTYAFVLTEDTAITYEVKSAAFLTMKLFNGALFTGSGDPASMAENVKFAGWSEAVADAFSFATFTLVREPASLLWLWILLAVLVLIALIVLIYALHVTGKIGTSFLTRFVVWLVGLFFSLCLAVAALGLKIAGLFGYSEDPDDYGFTEVNVEKETTEEATEEVAEEVSEDTVEEVTENTENTENLADETVIAAEVVEEVAEEVTEEVAEEATEEVAEEVTEEVAEEATEEVAEEATEEVAEEVTEEVAEEVTEEVAEEVTEEVAEEVTEEVAEEVTEEVAEEVTEEVAEEVTEEVTEEATEEVVEETAETEVSEDETKNNQ